MLYTAHNKVFNESVTGGTGAVPDHHAHKDYLAIDYTLNIPDLVGDARAPLYVPEGTSVYAQIVQVSVVLS